MPDPQPLLIWHFHDIFPWISPRSSRVASRSSSLRNNHRYEGSDARVAGSRHVGHVRSCISCMRWVFHLFLFVERMWLCNFCLARHPICTNSKEPCHRCQVGCDAGKLGKTRITEQPFGTITEFTDDDPNWLIFSDGLTPSTSEHNLLCFFWFQNVTIRSINLPKSTSRVARHRAGGLLTTPNPVLAMAKRFSSQSRAQKAQKIRVPAWIFKRSRWLRAWGTSCPAQNQLQPWFGLKKGWSARTFGYPHPPKKWEIPTRKDCSLFSDVFCP